MGSGFEDDGSIIMCACSSDRGGCDRRFRLRYFRYYSTAGMVGADNGPPCPRSWCAAPDQPPRRDDSMKVHFRVPAAAARSHPTRPWRHQATERCFLVRTPIFFFNGEYYYTIVKLRQGSGKDRQGMAVKVKGLKA